MKNKKSKNIDTAETCYLLNLPVVFKPLFLPNILDSCYVNKLESEEVIENAIGKTIDCHFILNPRQTV